MCFFCDSPYSRHVLPISWWAKLYTVHYLGSENVLNSSNMIQLTVYVLANKEKHPMLKHSFYLPCCIQESTFLTI